MDSGGHQTGRERTRTDGVPQAMRAMALVTRVGTWVPNEEAVLNRGPPPTWVPGPPYHMARYAPYALNVHVERT
jgi:hypothetical protein